MGRLIDRALRRAHVVAFHLRRGSPKRIVKYARQAQRLTPRTPLWIVIIDLLVSVPLYRSAFDDYTQWDYRILNGGERRTFMTEPKSAALARTFNSRDTWVLFDDKARFAVEFAADFGRTWIDLTVVGSTVFAEFLTHHGAVVAKDPLGWGGSGVVIYQAADVADPALLYAQLRTTRHTFVEQLIVQHPDLSRLYPGSVNTLRVVAYRDPDALVHMLARVLRIGNGGPIDNYSSGGMYTMLDETGTALHAACDEDGRVFDRHPVTGVQITGFQVPQFPQVLALVERLARQVPEMPYIGWDIAVTPDGPVVIEGNHNSGVFQSRPAVTGIRTGLGAVYEKAMRL